MFSPIFRRVNVTFLSSQLLEPKMHPYVGNLSRPDVGNGMSLSASCLLPYASTRAEDGRLVSTEKERGEEMDHPGFPMGYSTLTRLHLSVGPGNTDAGHYKQHFCYCPGP